MSPPALIVDLFIVSIIPAFVSCTMKFYYWVQTFLELLSIPQEPTPLSLRKLLLIPGNTSCSNVLSDINTVTPDFLYLFLEGIYFATLILLKYIYLYI